LNDLSAALRVELKTTTSSVWQERFAGTEGSGAARQNGAGR